MMTYVLRDTGTQVSKIKYLRTTSKLFDLGSGVVTRCVTALFVHRTHVSHEQRVVFGFYEIIVGSCGVNGVPT